ncbi:MAG: O-antigen ligase family protein [Chloroflexi bacterium]|nr:O-antigen ligase family protein [Chloroflexota bacterium]
MLTNSFSLEQRLPLAALKRGVSLALTLLLVAVLAILIHTQSLMLSIALLGGVAAAILVLLHPTLGLCLLAFTIPFGGIKQLALGGFTVDASDLLIGLIMISWLMRQTVQPTAVRKPGRWILVLILFLYVALLGLLPALDLSEAAKELLKWVEFALVWVFTAYGADRRLAGGVVASLLIAGSLQALVGISQFLSSDGPASFALQNGLSRAYGTFEQPNPFGGYLGLLLPIAFSVLLVLRPYRRREMVLWWLAAAAAALMGMGLAASGSRGAILGLVAGIVGLLIVAGPRQRLWLAVGIAILAASYSVWQQVVPVTYLERISDLLTVGLKVNVDTVELTHANFSLVERSAHWLAGWRMFERSPWLGVGLGQYDIVYPQVASLRWQQPLGHAHNYIINTMAEGGIVGLVSYLMLQAAWLWLAITAVRRGDRSSRLLGLAAVGMWCALMTHNLVDNLYVHYIQLLPAMLLGLVVLCRGADCGLTGDRT